MPVPLDLPRPKVRRFTVFQKVHQRLQEKLNLLQDLEVSWHPSGIRLTAFQMLLSVQTAG
jgi:hypothetical protein